MENNNPLSRADKLRSLADKPIYWFLKGKDFGKLEHDIRKEEYPFGSVTIETLGSGAVGKMNEDAPLVLGMGEGRTLIAVLDAASSQKKNEAFDLDGVSPAFYVSHLTSMGFADSWEYKDLCKKQELSVKDILIEMNSWIYKNLKDLPGVNYEDVPTVPGMAAVLMLVDEPNKRISIAQVADASAALVKGDGKIEVITPNLNASFDEKTMEFVHELVNEYGSDLSHIRQIPEAKERIRIHLAESFIQKTNKKGGTGVLNGMSELVSSNLVYSTDIYLDDKISSIVLFSDGAIQPYMTIGVSINKAAEGLVNSIYGKNQISPLKDGEAVLAADPDFSRIPRMKAQDDKTMIAVCFK